MRRVTACVTALCLGFSLFGMPAMAVAEPADPGSTQETQQTETQLETNNDDLAAGSREDQLTPAADATPDAAPTDEGADDAEGAGSLQGAVVDVELTSFVPRAALAANLTAQLNTEDGAVVAGPVAFGPKASEAAVVAALAEESARAAGADGDGASADRVTAACALYACLDAVPAGTYTLVVRGEGYGTFTQEVTLADGDRAALRLADSLMSGLDADEAGVGLAPYGDFNGNGEVGSGDASLLARAVADAAPRAGAGAEARFDLTGDGAATLADVQAFAATLGHAREGAGAQAAAHLTKDGSQMSPALGAGTVVAGDVPFDSLFAPDGAVVALAPADGQPVSADAPVEFSVEPRGAALAGLTLQAPVDAGGAPRAGLVVVELADGSVEEIPFSDEGIHALRSSGLPATGSVEAENGLVVIDFGARVAVKRITIRVTAVADGGTLAEIATVEFLNGMEDRIAPPDLNVPANLAADAADKRFTLAWDPQVNVTGYEVEVSQGGVTDVRAAVLPTAEVSTLRGEKLANETDYQVRVRSVNGDWRSPWGDAITVTPHATKAPAAPDGVTVEGGYGEIVVRWRAAEDAARYTLYYKAEDEAEFHAVEGLADTSYTVGDLRHRTRYLVYLTASNDCGTSAPSNQYSGETIDRTAKVPWYNLINRTVQSASLDSHIIDVTAAPHDPGKVPDFEPRHLVDGDYDTYFYSARHNDGWGEVTVTFDDVYEMSSFALTTYLGNGYCSMHEIRVTVDDGAGNRATYHSGSGLSWSTIANTPNSVMVSFPKAKVKTISLTYCRAYWAPVTISELAFYQHDTFAEEVAALWADDLHTVLADGVTPEAIEDIRARLNTPDPACGELHPRYELLVAELDNAMAVLNAQGLRAPVAIDPQVRSSVNANVGGLNAWQPLGVSAKAGEEVAVYVGGAGAAAGSSTPLRLMATQYHAESSSWSTTAVGTLKTGMNTVVIPKLTSLDVEKGGALYVEYAGTGASRSYAVRVVGGVDIPVLDLHGVTDEAERLARCEAYVRSLDASVAGLEQTHADAGHDHAYDPQNCVANATDVVCDTIMFSIPASQVLAGLGSGTVAERAAKVNHALAEADEMMHLFYQHKGLGNLTAEEQEVYGTRNGLPTARQNIRYMRMFAGAFMYAGGLHIGVEWGSTVEFCSTPGVSFDEKGRYQSGYYYGWGVSHEVGHEINQGAYAIAEVTNNYYAQLEKAQDTDDSTRFTYPAVYERVTSGIKGMSGGATGIAVYWQLHLAYDKGYNFKTYDTYTEQFNNLFFARVDAYARNQAIAPQAKEGGVALTLAGADKDNALMRLSCAAAERNLLAYFEAWGLEPNAGTRAYAEQFPAEERPIQYLCDSARAYQLEGGRSTAASTTVSASLAREENSPSVVISLSSSGGGDGLLGYEIKRNGVPVAFVTADQDRYVDTIATVNNRVFTYEVCGVDKHLKRTRSVTLDPVKVSHDGSLDKTGWTATSTLYAADDATAPDPDGTSCGMPEPAAAMRAIDGDAATVFDGALPEGSAEEASVTVSFGEELAVCALKYRAGAERAVRDYRVEVSADGVRWTVVKEGTFELDADGRATVWFNREGDGWLYTYDAAYLRLVAVGQREASVAELDVLGPTGDDVELLANGVGRLRSDLRIEGGEVVPAGSLVITGSYKGNPAYNALKLYDQDGRLIPGTQVIFADVPEQGDLGETAEGRWLYYLTPDDLKETAVPTKVRAELYRVDDAHSLEGERLVADTLPVAVPAVLPDIEMSFDRVEMREA